MAGTVKAYGNSAKLKTLYNFWYGIELGFLAESGVTLNFGFGEIGPNFQKT